MNHRIQTNPIKAFQHLIVVVVFVLSSHCAATQPLPDVFSTILQRDTSYTELSCNIQIEVKLPGLNMPVKEVSLIMVKGEETRIEGDGIMLLPKRGLLGQYQSIIETPCQAIVLMENADTVVYKLVSLLPESDWVTVDFTILKINANVHVLNVVTRENGVFNIQHWYNESTQNIPTKTIIAFKAIPMKLPLKFIAQNTGADQIFNADNPIDGRVILKYSDVLIK